MEQGWPLPGPRARRPLSLQDRFGGGAWGKATGWSLSASRAPGEGQRPLRAHDAHVEACGTPSPHVLAPGAPPPPSRGTQAVCRRPGGRASHVPRLRVAGVPSTCTIPPSLPASPREPGPRDTAPPSENHCLETQETRQAWCPSSATTCQHPERVAGGRGGPPARQDHVHPRPRGPGSWESPLRAPVGAPTSEVTSWPWPPLCGLSPH